MNKLINIYLLILFFKIVLSDLTAVGLDFKNRYSYDGSLCSYEKDIIFSHPDGIVGINWISNDSYSDQSFYQINKTSIYSKVSITDYIGEVYFHYNITLRNTSKPSIVSQVFMVKCLAPKDLKFLPISNFSYNFYKSTFSVYVNIIGLDDNTDPPGLHTGNTEFSWIRISNHFGKYKLTLWGVAKTFTPLYYFYNDDLSFEYTITSPFKSGVSYQDSVIDRRPDEYQMISEFDYPQYWIKLKPQERYPYLFLTYSFFNPPKLVSSNDDGSFNYFINLRPAFQVPQYNPDLYLQNFSSVFSISNHYQYIMPNIAMVGGFSKVFDDKNYFIFYNGNGSYTYNRIDIEYRWNDDYVSMPFPFGYSKRYNSTYFSLDMAFITTNRIKGDGYTFSIQDSKFYANFVGDSSDFEVPVILDLNSYDLFSSDGNAVLFRLNYSTPTSILKIQLNGYENLHPYKMVDSEKYSSTDFNIINGNLTKGVLEFLYHNSISENDYFELLIYDVNSNYATIQSDHYYDNGISISLPPLFSNNHDNLILIGFNSDSISDISFLFNDVNLTNSHGYNIMYLETNDGFKLPFNPCLQIIPQWDNITINGEWINSRYEFKFYMPPNIVPGAFEYAIKTPSLHYVLNTELPDQFQLNVISDRIDLMGPMVATLIKYPSSIISLANNENYNISWTFTIEDYNGFDKGYVVVIGSIDNMLYNISIVSPIQYSNELNITINGNACISQTYSIDEMVLIDRYGLNSTFFTGKRKDYTPNINPLYQIEDKSLFSIETECPNNNFTPPSLKSFDFQPKSIDVGSLDRKVTFTYRISIGSGIKQYPYVYLTTATLQILKCDHVITNQTNSTFNEYICTLTIPYGFGLPQDIMVSLYGLIGFGSVFGYSSMTLSGRNFPYSIKTSFTPMGPQKFPSSNFIVEFSQGYSLIPSLKSNSIIQVDGVNSSNSPFTISINNGNLKSNLYQITPYKIEFYKPPPSKCKGTPICGGPNHGTCDNALGCICNSPWVGVDCNSKVIIIPQPVFNTSSPTIILNETTSSDDSESNIIALINVVAIREIDYNNSVLHTYSFDKWIYTSNVSSLSTYSSNITNKDGSTTTTPISVNIEYFENENKIEFAGQEIIMKPSSIKYTISIGQYPFSTKLSQLQLIISTTAIINSDSCSNKEFDNTTSENSDYQSYYIYSY
ncbi:hypothetical protein ACTA71_008750 [Dictyostelium dimigraforme]